MATKQSENGQKKKAPAFSAKIDALCDTGSSTKAFASVCISGRFVVRDIAVMEGKNGWTKARTHPKGWLLRCKVAGVFRQSA